MIVETVKIKTAKGFAVINKSDFDPKQHKLAGKVTKKRATKKK